MSRPSCRRCGLPFVTGVTDARNHECDEEREMWFNGWLDREIWEAENAD